MGNLQATYLDSSAESHGGNKGKTVSKETAMLTSVCADLGQITTSTSIDLQTHHPAVATIPYPQDSQAWPDATLPRYPSDVLPTVLLALEQRWPRSRMPTGNVEKQIKVVLVGGIYRLHDPLLIQWRAGLSKRRVALILDALAVDPGWLSQRGYARLVADLRRFPLDDDRAGRTLGEVLLDLKTVGRRRASQLDEVSRFERSST